MLNTNFPPWPSYTKEESDRVSEILLSNKVNYWTGTETRQFEVEFAEWTGVSHAIAVANGTVALEMALRALGIGEGDEVLVSPRTYIASASCIEIVGAKPIFVDIGLDSQCIDPEGIERAITKKTKGIICVHLGGHPCDMSKIMLIASKYQIKVIEDCAQAHGASYKDKKVGSIGDIGCWSFCQDKIMTTGGEGGMITTNNTGLWSTMWSYKDHGKSWDLANKKSLEPGFKWIHTSFGTNLRLTELQSAIGRIQLGRMDDWNHKRTLNATKISKAASDLDIFRIPKVAKDIKHAWYKYYLFINTNKLKKGWNRQRVISRLNDLGVPCFEGSCPEVYLEEAFKSSVNKQEGRLKNAKLLGETSIMLLVHPTLTNSDIDKTCKSLVEVNKEALAQ
jgi:dTDP-4-amino-4,6-dideoxygalactose transaminase